MAKDMFFCCMDWKREDSHRSQKLSGLLIIFQDIYVLTHMRTEEDQMYFCLFFYVLLVTIENSPIPRPVFPSSSSGVLSEKEEQEENRLLAASTGPTQQTRAIISQRNSSFSEKNFFQFLSLLNYLGNQQLTNN